MEYRELIQRGYSKELREPNLPRIRRWKRSASRLIDRLQYAEGAKKRRAMATKAVDLLFAIAYYGGI